MSTATRLLELDTLYKFDDKLTKESSKVNNAITITRVLKCVIGNSIVSSSMIRKVQQHYLKSLTTEWKHNQ